MVDDEVGVVRWVIVVSIRATVEVLLDEVGGSGGFGGGRAPLGPDPRHQFPRRPSRKDLNAVNLSGGISVSLTWLDLWWQLSKQKPPINHRGHILIVSTSPHGTLFCTPLLAKLAAQDSPVRILNWSG